MAVYRYNPAGMDSPSSYSGSIGGPSPGSVSAAMAEGSDYPGAIDSNWFQSGFYTPDGSYRSVYAGTSLAPAAAAIPAGKDIIGVEVAVLGQVLSGGGAATTAKVVFNNNNYDVTVTKFWPDSTPGWGRTVDPNFCVLAADVAALLASARLSIFQAVPLGFPARIDYYSVYVKFTVGVAGEVVFPINLALDVSTPRLVYGAEIRF